MIEMGWLKDLEVLQDIQQGEGRAEAAYSPTINIVIACSYSL
jgi:hypothetical protein